MVWKIAVLSLENIKNFLFSTTFTLILGPTQLNIQWLPEAPILLLNPHSSFAAHNSTHVVLKLIMCVEICTVLLLCVFIS